MKVWILGGLLAAGCAAAAVHNLEVPFDKLALLDGRELAAGAIRNYDDLRETVLAVSGRDVVTVPLAQLPEPLAATVRSRVPARTAAELAAERAQAERKARDAERKQEMREREQAKEAKAVTRKNRAASLATARKRTDKTADSALVKHVEQKVTSHATSYFKTNSVVGKPAANGYAHVTIDLTTTEPVTGWAGRFRTTGRATVEPVMRGSAYAQDFEVVAEIDAKNVVRIIETRLLGPAN